MKKLMRFIFAPFFWLREIRDEARKIRKLTAIRVQIEIDRCAYADRTWMTEFVRKVSTGEPAGAPPSES